MAWTDVNFNEVNTSQELIPEGTYTFRVAGANRNKFDTEKVDVRLEIATTGPYQGVPRYLQCPKPDKAGKGMPASSPQKGVNKMMKLFINAVGGGIEPGEHPVDFLTRIVSEAEDRGEDVLVEARVDQRTFPDRETGEPITKNQIALRSVKAAPAEVAA